MTGAGDPPDPFDDALIVARLCAIDPVGLGGMVLRGGGEARDAVVEMLRSNLPASGPIRRLPVHADRDALFGGLDLAATLAGGTKVSRRGLLAEAEGGVVVAAMAERMSDDVAAQIAMAIDGGEAQVAFVALDDGLEADERPPAALAERLAFWVDLSQICTPAKAGVQTGSPPSRGHKDVRHDDGDLSALVATAGALGVDSARAPLFALRAARASAALACRSEIAEDDLLLAARLVLAPRATRMPAPPESAEPEAPPPPPPENNGGEQEQSDPLPLDEVVLAAALAALPKDVLARIAAGARRGTSRLRGSGERRKSPARGRPLGARAGTPRGGLRLALIDTLRAAAPWQKLRGGGDGRVRIRRDDLRIRRFETRAETLTIFAVDASGSSALARLAEAKGAVELLLAEAYVKRAQVALIAFRGSAAELLLPPTRSLARARKALAELPGGGGTPLAAGLNAARELAEGAKSKGKTPFVVILTDGRGNVAADGGTDRAKAQQDAESAAKAIGLAGLAGAFVDISARPRPEGAALAKAMGARYLPLPRADAAAMHAAVTSAQRL